MKRFVLAAAAIAATFGPVLAAADQEKLDYLPGGVICDRKDQVCYDGRGPNIPRTRDMFGKYAADAAQKHLDKKGEWGTKAWTFSNGVKCFIQKRVCKKDQGEGEKSKKITNYLYGATTPQPR